MQSTKISPTNFLMISICEYLVPQKFPSIRYITTSGLETPVQAFKLKLKTTNVPAPALAHAMADGEVYKAWLENFTFTKDRTLPGSIGKGARGTHSNPTARDSVITFTAPCELYNFFSLVLCCLQIQGFAVVFLWPLCELLILLYGQDYRG